MARRIDIPPRQVREWRHDLVAFRDTYVDYLNKTVGGPALPALRAEVLRRAQPAQNVLARLGADFVWIGPPVAGSPVMRGLFNTMFIHETPYGGLTSGMFGNWPTPYQGVIDIVDASLSKLEQMDFEVHRRRRNPLYWSDRILTALLGFPAYLLSKVIGVPASRIEESPLGVALRVAAFIVEAGVLVLGLNELFHWF
jgi:hypothetical protein